MEFESRSRGKISFDSHGLPRSLERLLQCLKSSYNRFLSDPFKFIIHAGLIIATFDVVLATKPKNLNHQSFLQFSFWKQNNTKQNVNIDNDTEYTDVLRGFSQAIQKNAVAYLKLRYFQLSSTRFPNQPYKHPIINVVWVTEGVVK
jgi:hypothetical protein